MTCTFFGHRDSSIKIKEKLEEAIIKLIKENEVNLFLVGNQGKFDAFALSVLKKIQSDFPFIKFYVVLAYLPSNRGSIDDYENTIYPEGLERVPKRFAISKRNEWMINKSDFVITYVTNNFGGSSIFKELSKKRGRTVIELS